MKKSLIFVVHKHDASHLHYDFRLEMDGVLKSWAIPKKPNEVDKRLAIQVEDHALSYAKFKGSIPEGQYGSGKVEIWDNGKYEIESKSDKKIVFVLYGKKLKGKYCLLSFPKAKNGWLFFKLKEK
jgi:DNA ligase D-like protein (predicted 3'-phosphoesterase)